MKSANCKFSQSTARRAAKEVGLVARKSGVRNWHPDYQGQFMVCDPMTGFPVAGFKFDFSADDVVNFCRSQSVS